MNKFFPQTLFAPEGVDGGIPAPAPAPVSEVTPAVGASESPSPSSTDFSGLSGDDYDLDADSQLPSASPEPPPVQAVGGSPAAVPGTTPAPVSPAPPVQPAAAVAPAVPPTPTPAVETAPAQPVQQPQDLGDLLKIFADNESDLVAAVADSYYKLSSEDLQSLEVDAAATVPKLLARSHVKTMQGMMQIMQTELPRMIQRQVTTMARQIEAETEFFSQFPQLSRDKHGADIQTVGKLLHQRNPNMSRSELLSQIGRTVAAMHSIGLTTGVQPTAPARPQQPAPFAPAISTPRVVATHAVPDGNDFGFGLAQDYDDN